LQGSHVKFFLGDDPIPIHIKQCPQLIFRLTADTPRHKREIVQKAVKLRASFNGAGPVLIVPVEEEGHLVTELPLRHAGFLVAASRAALDTDTG